MSPGQAEPRYDGIAQNRPEQTEAERAEEYRKWKEGESGVHVREKAVDKVLLYETAGIPLLFQKWKLKAWLSLFTVIGSMIPFVLSYPIWVIHFTPLRVLEGLLRLRIGGEATTPSIQFDTWSWGGSELRVEPTIWGEWWGLGPIEVTGVAGYFPSVAGFLLLFGYTYLALSIFIPKYRPLPHIFLIIIWIYVMVFSHMVGIPDTWV